MKLLAALAILCLLAGSAFAVAKLKPASVDAEKCIGCGACTEDCPAGAMTLDKDGLAVVDSEKCTGCKRCVASCPVEAVSVE